MDQKWIRMLAILVFYQQITPGTAIDKMVKQGSAVDISCKPGRGTLVIWFRVLDQSGMEFIVSLSPSGTTKMPGISYPASFSVKKNNDEFVLTLKSYKSNDSGIYSCGSLIGGNSLQFGEVTRLYEEKKKETTMATPTCTTQPTPSTTTTSCACKDKTVSGPPMLCDPVILAPLAGGCGLLLLLLIVVTVYCNNIRTRRCPHHYKRKPRMGAPEKMMTNI